MRYLLLLTSVLLALTPGCGILRRGGGNSSNGAPGTETQGSPEDSRLKIEGNVVDGIAATVNGRVITKSEVRSQVNTLRFMVLQREKNPAEIRRQMEKIDREALSDLVDREIILAEFEKKGGAMRPQIVEADINRIIRENFKGDRKAFLAELRRSRVTLRKFKEIRSKMLIVQFMQGSVTGPRIPATPAEVREYYKKHIADFREEGNIHLRTITIPKYDPRSPTTENKAYIASQRGLADSILKRLKNGENFQALARQYSKDSAASKGGDRGIISRETLRKDLSQVAFALKEKEISEVLEDARNLYILYVEEKQYKRTAPLEEVRIVIERRVAQERRAALVDRWLARLRRKAVIKYY